MGEPQNRIGHGRVIGVAGVIIEQGQTHRQVAGQRGQGLLQRSPVRSAQDFVGIQGQDPIGAVFFSGEVRQVIAARLLQVTGRIVAEQGEGQPFGLKLAENHPRAIRAVLIEDEVMIHPARV